MIRLLSRSTFLLGALLTFCLLALAFVIVDRMPARQVFLSGHLSEPQTRSLEQALAAIDAGAMNVDAVKAAVEALAWVKEARVSVSWPAGLAIEVVLETLLAYWNDDAFINEAAQELKTDLLFVGELPRLYGPPGSAHEVMRQYQFLAGALASSQHSIAALTLTARNSWEFETQDGVRVLLGKVELHKRTTRFLQVSASLDRKGAAYSRVDTRYSSGAAVQLAAEAMNHSEQKLAKTEGRSYD